MEKIMKSIDTTLNVIGSFIIDDKGKLLYNTISSDIKPYEIKTISNAIMQTAKGIEDIGYKIEGFDIFYSKGVLASRNIGKGFVVVLCSKGVNFPLLNLLLNVAVVKLKKIL
ncbi:MAG: hypothetical protein ACE5J9_06725 [Methanosarcinales archaeon]